MRVVLCNGGNRTGFNNLHNFALRGAGAVGIEGTMRREHPLKIERLNIGN